MKIILAPDSFKGTFSAAEVCRAFASGVRRVHPGAEILELPLADGGEGTLDVLRGATGGEFFFCASRDPLGRPLTVEFVMLPRGEALIEMARSSGLALLAGSERDPWRAGTFGLGLVIKSALELNLEALTLTLGGSATVDGGVGMARALGYRFFDKRGKPLDLEGGRILSRIARIDNRDTDKRLAGLKVRALCDVRNPLLGPSGAARVFAPQKGAGPEMVEKLEQGLANLALRLREDLGREVTAVEGGGAAGGMGAAVVGFLGGKLTSGIDYVLETLRFERALEQADLVITGEGSFDDQSLGGKVISGVLDRARNSRVPVAVVCGRHPGGGPAAVDSGAACPLKVFSGDDLPVKKAAGVLLDLDDLSLLAERAARLTGAR
ncbi:MAG: hypothetical protein A2Z86_12145 [Candidatus Glassbacteria bacterium GWA2_58_10]|uniref:Glycerate kinase n=1 Tax=Candidatus Glassbacteria bacterium GWA2_58_10 TaxID=1817865 RepID=A0A1F5YE20_9BACT|nr:MAG: hypothetical protein A2Z86_12145 [Candidatus Glassbacteria bacterium GWA2_58_10]